MAEPLLHWMPLSISRRLVILHDFCAEQPCRYLIAQNISGLGSTRTASEYSHILMVIYNSVVVGLINDIAIGSSNEQDQGY
jgi:hypothetical protein